MGQLDFVTQWTFDAPIARVWALLCEPEKFPFWWPGFEEVKTISGSGDVGSVTEHRVNVGFRLRLRFRMEALERKDPKFMRLGVAGDSAGYTEWRLRQDGASTAVIHVWNVDVQRASLRFMSRLPGAIGFFKGQHMHTMAAGRVNLERLLRDSPA